MHLAQEESGSGGASLVTALAQSHRTLEALLGAGEIASVPFDQAEHDPAVGRLWVELAGIDLHRFRGTELRKIELRGIEVLDLFRRGLVSRRRVASLGRGRCARLGRLRRLGPLGRGPCRLILLPGLSCNRYGDAGAEQQGDYDGSGFA